MKLSFESSTIQSLSSLLVLLVFIVPSKVYGGEGVVTLNERFFEGLTRNRIVFIKFFAPWCDHCKAMEEDWKTLSEVMADNKRVMIAEVDCTSEKSEKLCEEQDIQGFPTLKYGDPDFMQVYEGERDLESLTEFAKTGLKLSCSPVYREFCSEDDLFRMDWFMGMQFDSLKELADKVDVKIAELDDAFDDSMDDLDTEFDMVSAKADEEKNQIMMESDYAIMKQVLAKKISTK